ncbi:sigma-70 family RNA polymerase sigma factor [Microvirga terrae]|uniref:Sigma-70 family RNA polymerase sigma factor n=1 Tax=Microvirga terrae TaxID=2740529 RepID=A0ABY5RRS3_9HYPH|nr:MULTISPECIES: sigma-70 family RNA polymerase sigma factor [Microvirga]MBQ0821565.1 sigma-70 family RNA polymerase sigma factor [Microvirga sp. HBU67558]UVF19930.1 sigma-70 family RNA polymerase sigma factor [Microvirga terrae]
MRPPDGTAADQFQPLRPGLVRLAYRMLGSIAEAEDVVQEAYIRWHQADRSSVREPGAFLSKTVTRLCLDILKSARVKRETYIGPWLPEPVLDQDQEDAMSEDLSLTLMMALERLSPLERAAFLLHDVFGLGFDEVSATLDRDPAACRQLAARARKNVRADRPRYAIDREEGERMTDAFFAASRSGDVTALRTLLAENVVAYTDGGGIRNAALNPLFGLRRVAGLFLGIARKTGGGRPPILYRGLINGLPGIVTLEPDGLVQTTTLDIEDGRIVGVYIVRNPEKLGHLSGLAS